MAYEIDPSASVRREVKRVARERLDRALSTLDTLDGATGDEIEEAVHLVRKRCKEVRALARLVRPSLGEDFAAFNTTVRDAAELLSPIRDAHAVLATFDDLQERQGGEDSAALTTVRSHQAAFAADATEAVQDGDPRIAEARALLRSARKQVKHWKVGKGFDALGDGLRRSYARGRRAGRASAVGASDEQIHEWRKAVKTLWYHLRLLEAAAPSVMGPLVAQFDDLSEALGDDHDLAVLVARLESAPERFGGAEITSEAVAAARAEQEDLRRRAFRLGATLYAERPDAFRTRIAEYWECARKEGPELATGGIAELLAEERSGDVPSPPSSAVERERKFLVADVPDLPAEGVELRQGYLAIDGSVAVRVRDAGTCTLTVKAGRGAIRMELEWTITRDQFDTAWEQTRGRRVHKTRYELPLDGHTVEIDVFHDELDGLVLAEVEFDSEEALVAFDPPEWLGAEVTDDVAYTNASLAANANAGLPNRQD